MDAVSGGSGNLDAGDGCRVLAEAEGVGVQAYDAVGGFGLEGAVVAQSREQGRVEELRLVLDDGFEVTLVVGVEGFDEVDLAVGCGCGSGRCGLYGGGLGRALRGLGFAAGEERMRL